VSVLFGLLVLGARVRDLLWGIVCPRKLFERESSRTRGDNNGLSRCLVLRLVSSLGAKSVLHRSLFLYLSQKRKTQGEAAGEEEDGDGGIKIGETVRAGEYEWQRIEGITDGERIEPHFDTTFKTNLFNEEMLEVDIFRAFMPLDTDQLLHIIRENADEDGEKRLWVGWHVGAAIAIIFGGAQFKEGTNLWATKKVGMMPGPDFGRQLAYDRFERVLRYWARGLPGERERLRLDPWAQIDPWVKGYNEARLREIKPGSCLTPDEMMFEWKGKSGHGGLPHLSYIQRKPKPLGTELKAMCEGKWQCRERNGVTATKPLLPALSVFAMLLP
jgi:hypothetical protein